MSYFEPEFRFGRSSTPSLIGWAVLWLTVACVIAAMMFCVGCGHGKQEQPPADQQTVSVTKAIQNQFRFIGGMAKRLKATIAAGTAEYAYANEIELDAEGGVKLAQQAYEQAIRDKEQIDAAAQRIAELMAKDAIRQGLTLSALGLGAMAGLLFLGWVVLKYLQIPLAGLAISLSFGSFFLSGVAAGLLWVLPTLQIALPIAVLAVALVVVYFAWKSHWFETAGKAVVSSIEEGKKAGKVMFNGGAVKILDSVQGSRGKALVDLVQRERKAA